MQLRSWPPSRIAVVWLLWIATLLGVAAAGFWLFLRDSPENGVISWSVEYTGAGGVLGEIAAGAFAIALLFAPPLLLTGYWILARRRPA